MARILLAAQPVNQHTNALISVGQELKARGHEVAFLAFPLTRALLQSQGFLVLSSTVPLETKGDRTPASFRPLLPEHARDVAKYARSWGAAAIVADMTFPAAGLGAEQARLPWAGVHIVGLPFPGPTVPPPGSGLPIGEDWGWHGAAAAAQAAMTQWRADRRLRRARRALRLEPADWPLPGRVSPWLTLAMTTEVIEAPRSPLPETLFLVGPCRTRVHATAGAPFPLQELRTDVPCVYVSLAAAFRQNPRFFARVIQALAPLRVQIILDVGSGMPDSRSAGVPPNLVALRGVPHPAILPRVDLVLCDGTHETVTEALATGRPMLVAASDRARADNAARVAHLGAGLRVDPRRATRVEVRGLVERLLKEATFRTRSAAISRSLACTNGPAVAGELIERLIQTGEPVRRPAGCTPSLFHDSLRPWEARDLLVVR